MTRWGDFKRRARSEWKGFKVVLGRQSTQEAIKVSYVVYDRRAASITRGTSLTYSVVRG